MIFTARVKAEDTKKAPGSAMMETPVQGGKYRSTMDMTALLICKRDDSSKKQELKWVSLSKLHLRHYFYITFWVFDGKYLLIFTLNLFHTNFTRMWLKCSTSETVVMPAGTVTVKFQCKSGQTGKRYHQINIMTHFSESHLYRFYCPLRPQ